MLGSRRLSAVGWGQWKFEGFEGGGLEGLGGLLRGKGGFGLLCLSAGCGGGKSGKSPS